MFIRPILTAVLLATTFNGFAQSLYDFPSGTTSHVSSFENMNGAKGAGGKRNKTAKGNAYETLKPGESKTLLDVNDQGIIQRIWMTVEPNAIILRSLRLQMFWDGEQKPAVDVPLGDFFGNNLGRTVPYQSALFSTGEGRSFNCYIAMPFRKRARVVMINESKTESTPLFYDIDFIRTKALSPQSLYFHAIWQRQKKALGEDIEILPKIKGKGRFLGMSTALLVDHAYGNTWWGEGEVKMYLDGDSTYPSINGTGSEDYLGSAWGLGSFVNLYQGCTVADTARKEYNFYRLHVPDAIYFNKDIKVTIQQLGGGSLPEVKELIKKGVNLKPVAVDAGGKYNRFFESKDLSVNNFTEGWVNFYRVDDYAVTAYFYLDKPSNNLPPLANVQERIKNVKE